MKTSHYLFPVAIITSLVAAPAAFAVGISDPLPNLSHTQTPTQTRPSQGALPSSQAITFTLTETREPPKAPPSQGMAALPTPTERAASPTEKKNTVECNCPTSTQQQYKPLAPPKPQRPQPSRRVQATVTPPAPRESVQRTPLGELLVLNNLFGGTSAGQAAASSISPLAQLIALEGLFSNPSARTIGGTVGVHANSIGQTSLSELIVLNGLFGGAITGATPSVPAPTGGGTGSESQTPPPGSPKPATNEPVPGTTGMGLRGGLTPLQQLIVLDRIFNRRTASEGINSARAGTTPLSELIVLNGLFGGAITGATPTSVTPILPLAELIILDGLFRKNN